MQANICDQEIGTAVSVFILPRAAQDSNIDPGFVQGLNILDIYISNHPLVLGQINLKPAAVDQFPVLGAKVAQLVVAFLAGRTGPVDKIHQPLFIYPEKFNIDHINIYCSQRKPFGELSRQDKTLLSKTDPCRHLPGLDYFADPFSQDMPLGRSKPGHNGYAVLALGLSIWEIQGMPVLGQDPDTFEHLFLVTDPKKLVMADF